MLVRLVCASVGWFSIGRGWWFVWLFTIGCLWHVVCCCFVVCVLLCTDCSFRLYYTVYLGISSQIGASRLWVGLGVFVVMVGCGLLG